MRTFELTCLIEAYAVVVGCRPHISVSSYPSFITGNWQTTTDYDKFHRKTYKELSGMGVIAGLRITHPYRIRPGIAKRLHDMGIYGNRMWDAVKINKLHLSDAESYYSLGVHDHNLVFGKDIITHPVNGMYLDIKEELSTIPDVVRYIRYCLSHIGVFKEVEDKTNHPYAFFGDLHHFNPLKHMNAITYEQLKNEVAGNMGCVIRGEGKNMRLVPIKNADKKSNHDDFISLSLFIRAQKEIDVPPEHYYRLNDGDYNPDLVRVVYFFADVMPTLPRHVQIMWLDIIEKYRQKQLDTNLKRHDRVLLLSELNIPKEMVEDIT